VLNPGEEGVFTVCRNVELATWRVNAPPRYTYYDGEYVKVRLIDADLGASIVPAGQAIGGPDYLNSAGGEIITTWKSHLCGWNGEYDYYTDYRDFGVPGAALILGTDTNPPSVLDTRTVGFVWEPAGSYHAVSNRVTLDAKNERHALHAKFFDFTRPLDGFPAFDRLLPDLETAHGHMSATATTAPWPGLPAEMADTFGAVYTFEVQVKAGQEWTFKLTAEGAARLYVDDVPVLANISHGAAVQLSSAPVVMGGGGRARIRLEYYHNTGPAALTLSATTFTPPSYYGAPQLDPDQGHAVVLNPVCLPVTVSGIAPGQTEWTAPAAFAVGAQATHPDGIGCVEVYVDGIKSGVDTDAPYACGLANLAVNARICLRAEDLFGYGVVSNLGLTISRESMGDWLDRHGLTDPDGHDDGDGMSNREEYDADTNPTNTASAFVVNGVEACGTSNCVSWTGTQSPLVLDHYDVQFSSDLTATNPPGGWTSIVSRVPVSLSGSNRWWHVVHGVSHACYRVRGVPR
jgi:hypothetical protein